MGTGDAFDGAAVGDGASVAHDEATSDIEDVGLIGKGGTTEKTSRQVGDIDTKSFLLGRGTADLVVNTGLKAIKLIVKNSLSTKGIVIRVETGELKLDANRLICKVHVVFKPVQIAVGHNWISAIRVTKDVDVDT